MTQLEKEKTHSKYFFFDNDSVFINDQLTIEKTSKLVSFR